MKKYRKLLALGLAMMLAVMPAMTAFAETEGATEQQEVEEPEEKAPETENEAPELKEAETEETAVNTPSEAEEPEEEEKSEEEAAPEEEELKKKASLLGSETDDFLTFTAEEANSSVTFNYLSGTAYYSTDNGSTWTACAAAKSTTPTTITLTNVGDKVSFKGTDVKTGYVEIQYEKIFYHFSMSGTIAASGDVTSLTNSEGGDNELSAACYSYMFKDCASLTTAPNLPATTLTANCYSYMFYNCTSLTTAPELPATTLANQCYNNMFNGCKSLTTAPNLPATTLADGCYANIFRDCASLTTAPNLPAEEMKLNCYVSMFYGCTNLTTAPNLPATTLAESCYQYMFQGCTNLTTAPNLPSTTLAKNCYRDMFQGCTNLTTPPIISATSLGDLSCMNMFYGCTSLMVSESKNDGFEFFTCPNTSGLMNPVKDIFTNTGGTFKGEPVAKKTYYYVPPVTVTFDVQGHGTAPAEKKVMSGGKVTKPDDPTAEGYAFGGWYKEAGCTTKWNFDDTVSADTTLYAKWYNWNTLTLDTTAITLTDEAMTSDDAKAIADQMTATITKKTNDFVVYADGSDANTYKVLVYNESNEWEENSARLAILKAFSARGNSVYVIGTVKEGYTVSFDLNGYGAAAPEGQIVKNGGKVTKPTDPTAEGYAFGGWYKETGCTTAWDFEADTVTADTTLYAKWTQNSASEPSEEPKPSFTGTQNNGAAGTAENPVTGGQWNCGPGGQWTFRTNGQFKDTWGYIKLDNGQVGWFYFDKNGIMATGWQQVNGKWYYFNTNHDGSYGMMLTNTTTPDGYRVGPDGVWIR